MKPNPGTPSSVFDLGRHVAADQVDAFAEEGLREVPRRAAGLGWKPPTHPGEAPLAESQQEVEQTASAAMAPVHHPVKRSPQLQTTDDVEAYVLAPTGDVLLGLPGVPLVWLTPQQASHLRACLARIPAVLRKQQSTNHQQERT